MRYDNRLVRFKTPTCSKPSCSFRIERHHRVMYSSIYKSLANIFNKHVNEKTENTDEKTVDYVLTLLNGFNEESHDDSGRNVRAVDSRVSPAVSNCFEEELSSVDNDLDSSFDNNANGKTNSIGENKQMRIDGHKKKYIAISTQIQSLRCLFTWKLKLKSQNQRDMITYIENKYGDTYLDISISEFTFVRFIGNLIISYELYHKGESYASNMKIMEISNWLEKLDRGTDTFYLSINNALKHINTANFVHMLFAANETGGLKLLLNEIVPFDKMDNKSQAAVHAMHAVILIEYSESLNSFINACKHACRACELDPKTSQWFHINSLVLAAQRQFVLAHKSEIANIGFLYSYEELCPTENEINLAIQRAVLSSDGKHTCSVHSLVLTALNQFIPLEIQPSLHTLPVTKPIKSQYILRKGIKSNFDKDMKIIVEKHEKGKDAVPYLTRLIPKYGEHHKWKIMIEICSYSILFKNNLRDGIEHFLVLIEDINKSANNLIVHHNSAFINNSKSFNLAELIYNEIRLAMKDFIDITHKDYLFYYKMLLKIEETCELQMEVVNPFMKIKLINGSSAKKPSCSNATYRIETDETNIKSGWSSGIPLGNEFSNSSNSIPSEYFRYIQMQTSVEQHGMCENILSSSQQQYNLHNISVQDPNRYFNQSYASLNFFAQEQHSQPILLSQTIQSTTYTNNIITTNITSSSMNVDISLTKLPRGTTSHTTYKARLKKILKNYPNSFRIYTDASKIQDNVGIAIVSSTNIYSYKLSSEYTSNDAEAVAILRALDYALSNNYNDFIILSDSLTTLTCIQNLNTTSDIISSIFCIMHAHQLKGNIMHFIWVPSHNAIEGNEVADKLAKQIAVSETAVTYSHNSFMMTNIKYKFVQ